MAQSENPIKKVMVGVDSELPGLYLKYTPSRRAFLWKRRWGVDQGGRRSKQDD